MKLTDAMHDAARAAVPDRSGPDPTRVLHRIRRRRATRTAGYGVVAVAAAGALALGGSRLPLWDGPDPLPPAGPTSVPQVTGIECGQSFADVLAVAEPDATIDFAPMSGPLPDVTAAWHVSGRVTVSTTDPDGPYVATEVLDGVGLVVVDEHTVIGFGTRRTTSTPTDSEATAGMAFTMTACTADGIADGPLAAGTYEVYAVLPVTTAGHPDGDRDGFIVSAPVALQVGVADEPDDDPAAAYVHLPTCGESTAGMTATAGPLTGTTEVTVGTGDPQSGTFTEEPSGNVMQVRTSVTNVGPDIADATSLVTEGVLAQEGVVVATWFSPGGDLPPVDWPADTARQDEHGVFALERCDGGGPLGAGSYTAWALSTTGRLGSDGPALRVIHEPAEIRIEN